MWIPEPEEIRAVRSHAILAKEYEQVNFYSTVPEPADQEHLF